MRSKIDSGIPSWSCALRGEICMKRVLAGVLTVALMGLLLWSGLRRPAATPEVAQADDPAARPRRRLRALLDSAREGDVSAYLEAFAGRSAQRLEREVDERGRDAFAADLRRAARARKSHAVFAPEPDGPDTARITVEAVYPDRNERQTYRLDRTPGGWLVTDVETGPQPQAAGQVRHPGQLTRNPRGSRSRPADHRAGTARTTRPVTDRRRIAIDERARRRRKSTIRSRSTPGSCARSRNAPPASSPSA